MTEEEKLKIIILSDEFSKSCEELKRKMNSILDGISLKEFSAKIEFNEINDSKMSYISWKQFPQDNPDE